MEESKKRRRDVETQLYHGDCLEVLPTQVADGSVDLVLCDLPFGSTLNAWDTALPLEAIWKEYRRVCTGAIVLLAQTPFDKVLGASNLPMLRYEVIWNSTVGTGFLNSGRRPLRTHTNILIFYEKAPPHGSVYNAQVTTGQPYNRPPNRVSTNYNGKTNGQRTNPTVNNSGSRQPTSVIQFKPERGLHPTQKPVALMEYLIKTYSNPGDTVLDNCMGSGTTGVAAVNLGRSFIGIEKDARYFKLAEERILSSRLSTTVQSEQYSHT
jgi:site-specific DNA-methyltransferase (adenine-specific)